MSGPVTPMVPFFVEAIVTTPATVVTAVITITAPEFAAIASGTADSHQPGQGASGLGRVVITRRGQDREAREWYGPRIWAIIFRFWSAPLRTKRRSAIYDVQGSSQLCHRDLVFPFVSADRDGTDRSSFRSLSLFFI